MPYNKVDYIKSNDAKQHPGHQWKAPEVYLCTADQDTSITSFYFSKVKGSQGQS